MSEWKFLNKTDKNAPHVVILGAGASKATCPEGDARGNPLPLMNTIIKDLELDKLFKKHGVPYDKEANFEKIYSDLVLSNKHSELVYDLENHIERYFEALRLPDEKPTIYDYLILGLRKKDVIATFNWDPLLVQAFARNKNVFEGIPSPVPYILYLHGNVGIGYCQCVERTVMGSPRTLCPLCGKILTETKLLYPIKKKNYSQDPFIKKEWRDVQIFLKSAPYLSIFGYSAPAYDNDAVTLLKESWKNWKKNNEPKKTSHCEIIDIKNQEDLYEQWHSFFEPYYHLHPIEDFYKSRIYRYPRRTIEAHVRASIYGEFPESNCMPKVDSLEELQEWVRPLVEAEEMD